MFVSVIKIKRIYEKADRADGYRVFVDRLWPRGMKKEDAKIDLWLKDVAPSSSLRRWFSHDSAKWHRFVQKYHKELDAKQGFINRILEQQRKGNNITLLFGSKEEKYNNAKALKEYLQQLSCK